jgi:hypothetical protein
MNDETSVKPDDIATLLDIAVKSAPAVFPGLSNIHAQAVRELAKIDAAIATAWAKEQADAAAAATAEAA